MGFKTIALAGAATAALSMGIAAPALAAEPTHGGGCHLTCKNLPIMKGGVKYGVVHVWVHGKKINGVIDVKKTMKPGKYTFKGECKTHEHEHAHEHETTTSTKETSVVPSGSAKTGFGGASDQVSLPLAAGALSIITGGIGLGGLAARRRLSGVRS